MEMWLRLLMQYPRSILLLAFTRYYRKLFPVSWNLSLRGLSMFVFSVLLPVLAISLMGYLALKLQWFEHREADTLTRFTFNLLIPSLLFVSTARSQFNLSESLSFLAAYYLVVLLIFMLGVFVANRAFQYPPEEQSVFAMGCAYSNTTIVGIPIVSQALGEVALVPLFFIISIQNLVLFATGTLVAERKHLSAGSAIGAVRRLFRQLLGSPITGQSAGWPCSQFL